MRCNCRMSAARRLTRSESRVAAPACAKPAGSFLLAWDRHAVAQPWQRRRWLTLRGVPLAAPWRARATAQAQAAPSAPAPLWPYGRLSPSSCYGRSLYADTLEKVLVAGAPTGHPRRLVCFARKKQGFRTHCPQDLQAASTVRQLDPGGINFDDSRRSRSGC